MSEEIGNNKLVEKEDETNKTTNESFFSSRKSTNKNKILIIMHAI